MDWVTASSLLTALGTLVLAVATFASVRSGNRSARTAERALLVGLRPLLVASREQDAVQKVGFVDGHWVDVPGGHGTAEATDAAVYLTMSLRNVGSGVAVLHGWRVQVGAHSPATAGPPPVEEFRRLTRDLYIPAGDIGFWQGALRDPSAEEFDVVATAVAERTRITIDLMYGDHEGGQRVVSRLSLFPEPDGGWLASPGRHWNLDRPDPR